MTVSRSKIFSAGPAWEDLRVLAMAQPFRAALRTRARTWPPWNRGRTCRRKFRRTSMPHHSPRVRFNYTCKLGMQPPAAAPASRKFGVANSSTLDRVIIPRHVPQAAGPDADRAGSPPRHRNAGGARRRSDAFRRALERGARAAHGRRRTALAPREAGAAPRLAQNPQGAPSARPE